MCCNTQIAILTDTNSGITEEMQESLGVFVVPMPVIMDGKSYIEGAALSREEFYRRLRHGANVSTSQPSPGQVITAWSDLLRTHDTVIYIPMSGGLSGSVQCARAIASEYRNVHVVDNRRISVTLRQSVLEAKRLADAGESVENIVRFLEDDAANADIYLAVNTLELAKRSGRVTNAAATLSSVLNLKPVLRIQEEKLDAYDRVCGLNAAMDVMIDALQKERSEQFAGQKVAIRAAYAGDEIRGELWRKRLQNAFPDLTIEKDPLSISIACHTGEGALGVGIMRDYL